MAREHEIHRNSENHQNHGEHFEHCRPNGLAGHEFHHGLQDVMRQEQRLFRQMEQNMIRDGILPPNPFFNGGDQDSGGDQPPQQPQHKSGGILGGLVSIVKDVAPLLTLL